MWRGELIKISSPPSSSAVGPAVKHEWLGAAISAEQAINGLPQGQDADRQVVALVQPAQSAEDGKYGDGSKHGIFLSPPAKTKSRKTAMAGKPRKSYCFFPANPDLPYDSILPTASCQTQRPLWQKTCGTCFLWRFFAPLQLLSILFLIAQRTPQKQKICFGSPGWGGINLLGFKKLNSNKLTNWGPQNKP